MSVADVVVFQAPDDRTCDTGIAHSSSQGSAIPNWRVFSGGHIGVTIAAVGQNHSHSCLPEEPLQLAIEGITDEGN